MPRPETGSFNRLITSIGLLLLAAALVIPYFYYRSTDVLEISRDELRDLTPTSQSVIESRQTHVSELQPYVLPVAGMLIVGGIIFLSWGGVRLRGAQDRDDREAEARAIAAEAGLRDLTPEEKEEKLAEDVEPESTQEAAATEPPPRATAPVPAPQTGAKPLDPRTTMEQQRRERVEAARTIERSISKVLSDAQLAGYRFRPQVAVGKLKLDGLFISEEKDRPDVLLEIRVGARMIHPMMQDRVLARIARYEAERARVCRAWFVVVVSGEERDARYRNTSEMRALNQRLDDNLEPLGAATVVREEEIFRLDAFFADRFITRMPQ